MRKTIFTMMAFLGIGSGFAWADAPVAQSSAPPDDVVAALVAGDNTQALRLIDRDLASSPDDAWLLYSKGSALIQLKRLDAAVDVLRLAENDFPNVHEKGLAIYRRAIALDNVVRCDEAHAAFAEYVAMVKDSEPDNAQLAVDISNHCERPTVIVAQDGHVVRWQTTTAGISVAAGVR